MDTLRVSFDVFLQRFGGLLPDTGAALRFVEPLLVTFG
jgi:hypothetical protein